MCCEHKGHHGGRHGGHHGRGSHQRRHHHGGFCGCGRHHGFERRFLTREEKIARLERYLGDLREEAKAVEEHIAEMQEGK